MGDQRRTRESLLSAASDQSVAWDIVVIGGGATGLSAAWDAVSRGLRVALIERNDFAGATSSRSTKLVHGGVRYLQQGDLALVREALKERKLLLENAPEFARPLRFVLPATHPLSRHYYRFGMLLYDLLAGKAGIGRAELLSESETRARLPGIALENLKGGVGYSDAQFDDASLAVAMAQAVCAGGGTVLNYAAVKRLTIDGGKVAGVEVEDGETGRGWEMRAKAVINATGIFADELREANGVKAQWSVRTSRGSHIVCPRAVLPGDHALIIPKTRDGRVLFAIPWKRHVVIGTTDVPTGLPTYGPVPSAEEVGFILEEAGRALGVTAADVTSQWSGLRPLVGRSPSGPTASLSRKHVIEVSPAGLVSVLGGKWTTCRKMGEDAIDAALDFHGTRAAKSATASRVLTAHGARVPGYDLIRESPGDFGAAELRGCVLEACRYGFARTLEDVMARRLRLLQLDAAAAIRLAPQLAETMAEEMGWDRSEALAQVSEFRKLAADYLPN